MHGFSLAVGKVMGNTLEKSEKNKNKHSENSTSLKDEQPSAQGLNEELEDIRSKFQQILDETVETYLAGGDIQAYDDEPPVTQQEQEPIKDDDLCECCGEEKRDKTLGEDYPYCAQCRKLMQQRPISFSGILALICVLLLIGVSVFYIYNDNSQLIKKSYEADKLVKEGKLYSASDAYTALLSPYAEASSALLKTQLPKKVAARYAKLYASLADYETADKIVKGFFSDDELKNPIYKFLNEYSDKNETFEKIKAVITVSNITPESAVTALEKIRNDGGDDFLIDFYEYAIERYMEDADMEACYEKLTALREKYPKEIPITYELCYVCSRLGKVDEVERYCKELIKHNCERDLTYVYYADAYLLCDEPDVNKALAIINEGLAALDNPKCSKSELNRTKALCCLLMGEYDQNYYDVAYDAAYEAFAPVYENIRQLYESNYPAYIIRQAIDGADKYLYTIQACAYFKGDKDFFAWAESLLAYLEFEPSKDVDDLINGKAEIKDILSNKEGDLI